jgi:hypothetical protein
VGPTPVDQGRDTKHDAEGGQKEQWQHGHHLLPEALSAYASPE